MDEAGLPFNSLVENGLQRTCESGIVGVHYTFEFLARQGNAIYVYDK